MEKINTPKRFKWPSNNEVPPSMLSSWQNDGFLIINDFYSKEECLKLKTQFNVFVM